MKIYFTCSTAEFEKYEQNYFAIRDHIVKEKHTLTRDWLNEAKERIERNLTDMEDVKDIYKKCIDAINKSDLVIIEDTVSNFSTGHQITVALQRQKPTLVLWNGKKQRHFKSMFINGIESDLLEIKEYDGKDLEIIISRFIKKYENGRNKNRFHLVLDQYERDYLDWAQYNKSKSRTKLIKDSLKKYMNDDDEYLDYLDGKA